MLAAVLWLGNVSFTAIDNENTLNLRKMKFTGLSTVAKLIGCNINELKLALSNRNMKVRNDTIIQKLTLSQAIDARDALAKSIYACLFDWLVEQINKSLAVGKRRTGRSISILDIYGFESFDKNSFEQFCINYANERLQHTLIVIYSSWSRRNIYRMALTGQGLILRTTKIVSVSLKSITSVQKPLGLLSLLDEESTFPNGTDLTLANKLKEHLSANSCFRGDRGKAFTVSHYAGEVTYETTGFLEKNRDLLHSDSIKLLSSCSCHLPQAFASSMLIHSEKPVLDQLFQLMQRLGNTTPHFIRCIKPNNVQSPGLYEQGLVLQQLRCCGVLEVVRFPSAGEHRSKDPLSVSVAILHQFNILPEMYQVGYTKLFFRTGQIGVLEDTRNRTLHGILRLQSCFRGHQARSRLREHKRRVTVLQSCITPIVRGEKVRNEYTELLRRHRASAAIQSHVKRRIAKKQYKATVDASVVIQSGEKCFIYLQQFVASWLEDVLGILVANIWRHQGPNKRNDSDEVLVKASVLSELQRRVLKSEAALREKEEENDILRQRLQQYDNRWSEYETKMKSMEEIWQKQMRSLQSSLSIAKKSLEVEDSARNSDASVNASDATELSESGGDFRTHGRTRSVGVGLSVISRLAEEFGQRAQVFGDDTKFLMEVKSGQVEANLDPERELRRLKQMFDTEEGLWREAKGNETDTWQAWE
ncbi:hypothetical protein HID58_095601 [Brassica napus]|uniref:Myosin motor domain-containing protein n=1 Tax=Brassica napus TaxID=3708 RepID=A0ABQ7X336_BRANA|nr:hypothetical protein HID58_095601 [Brassica napus]